jgi:hypothetical protein
MEILLKLPLSRLKEVNDIICVFIYLFLLFSISRKIHISSYVLAIQDAD